ncbi:MAG: hypothetical protein NTW97_00260 [Candidatus Krumholzibacteria bacterium]|nr:hypothetical protein [Candidatus Krumholzibacteria bacterium]
MKRSAISACVAIFVIAVASTAFADNSGRLYGKLTTVDGDVYEGLIRWDKNEASWGDILNGTKELHRHHSSDRNHEKIVVFGITIGDRWSVGNASSAQSGLCFGHIRKIEPLGDDAVRLTLKSGEQVRLEGGSTDIGDENRGIVIEDSKEGEIAFDWDEVESVDFSQGPANLKSEFGERLYGTMTTRHGDEYTGWVSWDADELFTNDVLDGEHKDHTRKIAFDKIRSIERRNSNGATLTLANGDEIVLRETNDVDDSNRGIAVYDPAMGQITADWDAFEKLEFKTPPAPIAYDRFDGGRRLEGTVYTDDGEKHTGVIRWDDDEEFTWEILDGEDREVTFDIEFGNVKEIKPVGFHAATVTLWDGRSFKLRGTNDVDDDNNGIYVKTSDGKKIEIEWDEVDRVEFAR